jgi:hypothetical protein
MQKMSDITATYCENSAAGSPTVSGAPLFGDNVRDSAAAKSFISGGARVQEERLQGGSRYLRHCTTLTDVIRLRHTAPVSRLRHWATLIDRVRNSYPTNRIMKTFVEVPYGMLQRSLVIMAREYSVSTVRCAHSTPIMNAALFMRTSAVPVNIIPNTQHA